MGGDGAYSIDLGDQRVLWLFGDSIIDPGGSGRRSGTRLTMVDNSVAIQHGYDPATAHMRFYWRRGADGSPGPWFSTGDGDRFWPGHGALVDGGLLLFLMRVRNIPTGLGFEVYGWEAVWISNPAQAPPDWTVQRLEAPTNHRQIIIGSAGVLIHERHLYAFGSREPHETRAFLVRWTLDDIRHRELGRMEWWTGEGSWLPGAETQAIAVLIPAPTEFTVHRDPASGCFLAFQTVGFGPADVTMRSAPRAQGPWSRAETLFRPPEYNRANVLIYQGKAHPHLEGADIVLTYSTNSTEFDDLTRTTDVYYPRFVRLTRR